MSVDEGGREEEEDAEPPTLTPPEHRLFRSDSQEGDGRRKGGITGACWG